MAKMYLFSYELYLRSGEHKAVEVEAVDEATARIKAANMAPSGDLLSVDLIGCADIPLKSALEGEALVDALSAAEVAEFKGVMHAITDGDFTPRCSVCGRDAASFDAAVDAGWMPTWLDLAGEEREEICESCIEALGLEFDDDDGFLTFPVADAPTGDPLDADDPAPM